MLKLVLTASLLLPAGWALGWALALRAEPIVSAPAADDKKIVEARIRDGAILCEKLEGYMSDEMRVAAKASDKDWLKQIGCSYYPPGVIVKIIEQDLGTLLWQVRVAPYGSWPARTLWGHTLDFGPL